MKEVNTEVSSLIKLSICSKSSATNCNCLSIVLTTKEPIMMMLRHCLATAVFFKTAANIEMSKIFAIAEARSVTVCLGPPARNGFGSKESFRWMSHKRLLIKIHWPSAASR